MKISRGLTVTLIIIGIVIIDQVIKIWVKTHFYLGESYGIASWFKLVFVENNGMAFGMELGSKLALTLFRIIAVAAIVWYIIRIRNRKEAVTGYLICWALIAAGAAGNILDCIFYGYIFNNPVPPAVATLFPADGGYAPLFMGKVVDMFYFPLFSFYWPEWVPFVGGDYFLFFQPVFNLADAAISVGIIALLIFYSRHFVSWNKDEGQDEDADVTIDSHSTAGEN